MFARVRSLALVRRLVRRFVRVALALAQRPWGVRNAHVVERSGSEDITLHYNTLHVVERRGVVVELLLARQRVDDRDLST